MSSSAIVQKLWITYSVIRDDGMCYSDYVEQLRSSPVTLFGFTLLANVSTTEFGKKKPNLVP